MKDNEHTLRPYNDLAWLWPIWGSAEQYADYCKHVVGLMREHAQIPVHCLLNVGCGGGKNVFNLKIHYDVTGLDLSPRMLELAQDLNPEYEFVRGDMRSFSIEQMFDSVLVGDAVSYMTSIADLRATFIAAWRHLRPGGVMVVSPDDTKETFVQNYTVVTNAAGKRKPANIDVVFVENSYDPDPDDDHYEGVIIYLIREAGNLRVETDRHILGLFTFDVWRETLTEVGFRIHEETYVERDKEYVSFACLKPAWQGSPTVPKGPMPRRNRNKKTDERTQKTSKGLMKRNLRKRGISEYQI